MLAGMMALGVMAQAGKFTVRGTFEDVGDSVSFMIRSTSLGQCYPVTGQMMEAEFDLNNADYISIGRWFAGRNHSEKGDVTFPAIPGETLVVSKDADGKIQVGGSQFYVDYNEAQKSVEAANQAAEDFVEHIRTKLAEGVPQEDLMDEFQTKMPILIDDYVNAVKDYVRAHPDQDASAALIAELPEEIEYFEDAAALLTERARGSVAANLYKKTLKSMKKKAEEEAYRYALQGCDAPDFTLMDINGNPLSLSSLRGKWVVIDFWGSWCGWCIKGMPMMKEYYAKYQGELEILGVDCNDTVEKWKGAVAQHELPWLHVYCDMEDENSDNPVDLYNVRGFPTKVVVNPEGVVAKIIIGEDPTFYDYLDEVLK
ncbi:MAG: TlpA family protein disulfide reductase [Muribaculaceae bacterium]|nr:TlpA family protein disulfide reductase [Muribaculaceae bacterium]